MATIRKSQITGTLIAIGNGVKDSGMYPDTNPESPWYTLCMAHDKVRFHGSIHTAREFAGDPTSFCDDCREAVAERKKDAIGFLRSQVEEFSGQIARLEQTPVLANRDFVKFESLRSAVVKAQKKLGNLS